MYLLQEVITGGTNKLHRWRRQACEGGKGRWACENAASTSPHREKKFLHLHADFFSNLNFRNHVHAIEVHLTHGVSSFQLELALKPLCFLLQVKGVGGGRGESDTDVTTNVYVGPA